MILRLVDPRILAAATNSLSAVEIVIARAKRAIGATPMIPIVKQTTASV